MSDGEVHMPDHTPVTQLSRKRSPQGKRWLQTLETKGENTWSSLITAGTVTFGEMCENGACSVKDRVKRPHELARPSSSPNLEDHDPALHMKGLGWSFCGGTSAEYSHKHPSDKGGRQSEADLAQTRTQLGKLPCRGAPTPLGWEHWCRCCIGERLHLQMDFSAQPRGSCWPQTEGLSQLSTSTDGKSEQSWELKSKRLMEKSVHSPSKNYKHTIEPGIASLQLPPAAFLIQQSSRKDVTRVVNTFSPPPIIHGPVFTSRAAYFRPVRKCLPGSAW